MADLRPLDPVALRRDFPLFERDFGGRSLAYLDSAATILKPRAVLDAVAGYNEPLHRQRPPRHLHHRRGGHRGLRGRRASEVGRFLNARETARDRVRAQRDGGDQPGRLHVGPPQHRPGDTIVLTELEHHSNLVPWQLLAQEKDADLEFVAIDDQGRLNQESYEVLLRTQPKLVAFTARQQRAGHHQPGRARWWTPAHAAGALVLVDAAQAVPHGHVDVQAWGADFYVFSGHKVLGPTGSGALWARRELLEAMPPFMGGGEMIREVHLRRATLNDVPWKFEAGTPDIAPRSASAPRSSYLAALGMDAVRAHERDADAVRAGAPAARGAGHPHLRAARPRTSGPAS